MIKPPIIVDAHGDPIILGSVEDAEAHLEAIDVENDEYVAYDSEGRILRLIPTSPRITIESAEQEPQHAEELRAVLVSLLTYTGESADWLKQASLQELVDRALEYKIDLTYHPSFEKIRNCLKRWLGRT